MKRISVILIVIFILCSLMIGCQNRSNVVKEIRAEYLTISYEKSIYEIKDKIEQDIISSLVGKYNNIKLIGTTNHEINYDKAITIIFINKDQISGKIVIDDKGVCRIGDNQENNIISNDSDIYIEAVSLCNDLQAK